MPDNMNDPTSPYGGPNGPQPPNAAFPPAQGQFPQQGPGQPPQGPPQGPGYQNYPPGQGPFQPGRPSGQPGGQPPYGQGFAAASGHTGQPPTKKSPVGWIVGGTVALVVVVAITLFATGIVSLPGGSTSSAPPKNPKEAAQAVVKDYLEAVADGRAEDALKKLDTNVQDDSLLTNEVLKDSLERAPIADIEIDEAEGTDPSFRVKAKYSVAGDSASEEFRVSVDGSEAKIDTVLPTLGLFGVKDVDVKVNGAKAKSETPAVFPGSYKVQTGNKYLEIEGDATYTVRSTTKTDRPSSLSVKVSDEGVKMFREKVLPEAKKCLASKALNPGCNMQLTAKTSNGFEIRDGSITRTQDSAARTKMEKVVPKADVSLPTVISSQDFGHFTISAECKGAGQSWQPCTLTGFGSGSIWGKASIDVTDPNLKVTWD